MTDHDYMQLAIEQARVAQRDGEIPIGAVLVKDGAVIVTGQNRVLRDHDPTAHAEVVALRAAGGALNNYRLNGCDLYVTLEPCAMCAGAMMHARIRRLVYGARDPKAGANGSVLQVLNFPQSNHKVEVVHGVAADICGSMLRDFFAARREPKAVPDSPRPVI